ncbi:MAG TPA: extracellular solute-binding protein, partial [Rhizomicrobium sp.]|nr:extracellular solute-binding protein [Rhizomicrobium sp.]
KAGAKVETVAPKEGIPLYISGFVIPKNAPNKDGAHVWLNEMLVTSAQEAFAEDMGYNPSVGNATIPPATEKRIGFNADERKRLIDLDYGYLAKNDAAFKEWWDKTFKG